MSLVKGCERELLEFAAAEQHGVFSRVQALHYGLTERQVDWRVESGRWERVQPQSYRAAGTPLTRSARLFAAVLAVDVARRTVAVSHSTAAALHGVKRCASDRVIELSVTGTALPLLWDVTVHRTSGIADCDLHGFGRLSATSGARTVVDLVQPVDLVEAVAIADEAVGARATGAAWLHRRACALANGRRNVSYLAKVTRPGAEGEFRSWLERHGAGTFRAGHLPEPRWNVPIRVAGRLLGVADTVWDPVPLILQLDGPAFHDHAEGRDKDRKQDRSYAAAGYTVLRAGYWEIVRTPEAVVADVRAALIRLGHPGVKP